MGAPTCKVIRPGGAYQGQQDLTYVAGLNGATAGSRAICMTLVTLPPGARAKAHLHHGIETAVYVIEGEVEMYFGARLGERLVARAGEYVYIPADTAHLVMNRTSATGRAIVTHTSPDDQAGIVLLPELDAVVPPT
jgi:uncharacterized RmlC-like cupin family protein